MPDNVVWESRSDDRFIIRIVATPNWKGGIPLDQRVWKWLVKIDDKLTGVSYCPTDEQFPKLPSVLTPSAAKDVIDAFQLKEEHNRRYLKNPEVRGKEDILTKMLREYRRIWGYND